MLTFPKIELFRLVWKEGRKKERKKERRKERKKERKKKTVATTILIFLGEKMFACYHQKKCASRDFSNS